MLNCHLSITVSYHGGTGDFFFEMSENMTQYLFMPKIYLQRTKEAVKNLPLSK